MAGTGIEVVAGIGGKGLCWSVYASGLGVTVLHPVAGEENVLIAEGRVAVRRPVEIGKNLGTGTRGTGQEIGKGLAGLGLGVMTKDAGIAAVARADLNLGIEPLTCNISC